MKGNLSGLVRRSWARCSIGAGHLNRIAALGADERGTTAVEYGLLISLLVFAFVGALSSFDLSGRFFEPVAAYLTAAARGG